MKKLTAVNFFHWYIHFVNNFILVSFYFREFACDRGQRELTSLLIPADLVNSRWFEFFVCSTFCSK